VAGEESNPLDPSLAEACTQAKQMWLVQDDRLSAIYLLFINLLCINKYIKKPYQVNTNNLNFLFLNKMVIWTFARKHGDFRINLSPWDLTPINCYRAGDLSW